jgi:hypothetical protein
MPADISSDPSALLQAAPRLTATSTDITENKTKFDMSPAHHDTAAERDAAA